MSKPLKMIKMYFSTDDLAEKLDVSSDSLYIAHTSTNGQYIEFTVIVDNSVESEHLVVNTNNLDIRREKLDL